MSCASSVATRGIMYSMYPRPVAMGNKWHPLHKPQWLEVNMTTVQLYEMSFYT